MSQLPESSLPSDRRRGPWLIHMRWTKLLFMHWALRPQALMELIPSGLELDTFEGNAWLGIVPFRMSNVRPRGVPPLGPLSAFAELNVRTYVRCRGLAGVWFFSLDAASRLAVRGARLAFHLPYFDAKMSVSTAAGRVSYDSVRTHKGAAPAELHVLYGPTGPATPSRPNSLDDFLTNRLCLFAADSRGRIYRGDIDHPPWPLQSAEAEIQINTMTGQIGVKLPDVPPLLHYAERLDVVGWRARRVSE